MLGTVREFKRIYKLKYWGEKYIHCARHKRHKITKIGMQAGRERGIIPQ